MLVMRKVDLFFGIKNQSEEVTGFGWDHFYRPV